MEIIQNIIGMAGKAGKAGKAHIRIKGQIFYVELYNVLLFCKVTVKMHVTYNEWILVV